MEFPPVSLLTKVTDLELPIQIQQDHFHTVIKTVSCANILYHGHFYLDLLHL